MKKGIHPDYHTVIIQTTSGQKYETRSTWGKEGDVMVLDIDTSTHPAWTGAQKILDTGGRMSKFNSKYASFVTKK